MSLVIVGSLALPLGSQAFDSKSEMNISAAEAFKTPTTKEQQKKECHSCSPAGNQLIYIPLIELPESKKGELVFNSRSPNAMEVTPVFYKRNGETVIADPVQIQSGEIRYVNIRDLLPERYRQQHNWGGFALSYYGTNREMWAQFRFLAVNGGGNVDEFFTVKDESRSSIYEAAWWMPEKSEALVVLGNIGDTETTATVTFGDGRSRTVTIAPHATESVKVNHPRMGAESVKINVTGPVGSVIPTGIITARDGSFNSVIRFYDPTKAKQGSLFANGLRVRGMTPHMILKNTTSSGLAVAPKFIPLAGKEGLLSLSPVVLGPNETTEVDLTPLVQASGTRKDLGVVSVEVTNETQPGSVIGSLFATNEQTGVSYDVPLRDSGPVRSMTGAYPWKIAEGFSTIAYLTNITGQETEFIAEINYDGGKFTLAPRKLAAGATAVFDLRKIRDAQMKDYAGKAVPASASMGQFRWAVRGVTDGKIVLIGRAEMVNLAENISTSYSCPMDCGPYYDVTVNYPSEIPQGLFGMGSSTETASWNYGYTMGPYSVAADWSVDNTNIVSFGPSSGNDMTINGTQVGEANVLAFIGWQEVYDWDGLNCVDLGYYAEQGGGPVQTVCAVPNNFHQVGSGTNNNGTLHFVYAWDSSTGNLADLSQCTIGEIVAYPGTSNPYVWPNPPMNRSSTNPTVINVAATGGTFNDDHQPPNSFVMPFQAASFSAVQAYRYQCACASGGNFVNLITGLNIARSVTQNSGQSTFRYTVTKSGSSATINPIQ